MDEYFRSTGALLEGHFFSCERFAELAAPVVCIGPSRRRFGGIQAPVLPRAIFGYTIGPSKIDDRS